MNFPFMAEKFKTYVLPLTRDYVAHWGVTEAVRELLQNAIDSDSPFRCTYMDGVLRIVSAESSLPTRTLLLGATSKAHDETKIGSFGEGYKIAMLVLTRMDKPLVVYNDKVIWTPDFRVCESFGEETLHINEAKRDVGWDDRLIFEIHNINETEYEAIRLSCVHLWTPEQVGEVIETEQGRIMTQHQGKIYVNGLYVCDMELDYSYDFNPCYLKLERDRQTVSGFDVKLLTKNMWFESKRFDQVAEMIEAECPDLEYANFSTPELVKDACYRLFTKKNPGAVAVKTQRELDSYVANGMTTVIVSSTTHSILTSTPAYNRAAHVLVKRTPQEELEGFLRKNRGLMRREAIVDFKDLVQKAQGWSIKGS